ncbi:MAG: tetratricopeptide repeat protein [Alphaproteobacteria bacterium]|nr:tetratricopeptide repeat protein [Alphaproteobacteria bacterium]
MPLKDRFGLPVTCATAAALEDYITGVDLLLSAWPGAEARLDRALAADPDFALAHIARARLLQLQARMPEAKAAAADAGSRADRVTARERRHIEAITLTINGAAGEALAMVRAHTSEYPRDALPLSLALGVFGLLGFSGRRDHHELQLALLEELAPNWGDDWWFLGYLGWAYIETGEVAKGVRLVERSLAGNQCNAHAAHQRVHGFFESGDAAGGVGFLESWLKGYDRAGHLHCHLSWHLALFELACGDAARAQAIYLDNIRPSVAQAAPMLVLADSASFLWRWRFYDMVPSLDQEWAEVAAHARRYFPHASLAFADLHAALAEAATGNVDSLQTRIAGLQSLANDGRLPPGEVAPALCAGAAALGRGDDSKAAQIFEPALADLSRIGGSHAQREVFEDSLIVAYLRSGQSAKAAPLLSARLGRRPSARDEAWLALCSSNGPER